MLTPPSPKRPAMPRLSCSITFDPTTVYPFTKGDLSIQLNLQAVEPQA